MSRGGDRLHGDLRRPMVSLALLRVSRSQPALCTLLMTALRCVARGLIVGGDCDLENVPLGVEAARLDDARHGREHATAEVRREAEVLAPANAVAGAYGRSSCGFYGHRDAAGAAWRMRTTLRPSALDLSCSVCVPWRHPDRTSQDRSPGAAPRRVTPLVSPRRRLLPRTRLLPHGRHSFWGTAASRWSGTLSWMGASSREAASARTTASAGRNATCRPPARSRSPRPLRSCPRSGCCPWSRRTRRRPGRTRTAGPGCRCGRR